MQLLKKLLLLYNFTCVKYEDAGAECWGKDVANWTDTFAQTMDGNALFAISVGANHLCAQYFINDGRNSVGMCWGDNSEGQVSLLPHFVTSSTSSSSWWLSSTSAKLMGAMAMAFTALLM